MVAAIIATAVLAAGCGRFTASKEQQPRPLSAPPTTSARTVNHVGRNDAVIAAAEARRLLRSAPRPSGCTAVTRVPAGASDRLTSPAAEPASPYVADAHGYCVDSLSAPAVVSWFAAHEPAGAIFSGQGVDSSRSGVDAWSVGYSVKAPPFLPEAEAEVTVARLGSGRSVLRYDGLVLYCPSRPAGETIPSGASRLVVKAETEARRRSTTTITDIGEIATVVTLLNRLERPAYVSNPGGYNITLAMTHEEIALDFYGPAGHPRLLASVVDRPLLGEGTGNVEVRVGGRPEPVLGGTTRLVREASILTGVRLVP